MALMTDAEVDRYVDGLDGAGDVSSEEDAYLKEVFSEFIK